ncbi:hypothetical protein AtNW77_Chr5g0101111 [Arabidopsis thaliana]|uniref:Cystatin/monellin superfamily protein n=2 Tax=Arabidopsis TaxID=3701 RepID=A0A178UQ05_ARATH|nr:Cystatin-related plant [Arabidopsis thaliana x Arabidopsis arenosa]OAO95204.1 hypothetical protein AXX17_AT5G16730 [Arabidopsis thaliana]
MTTNRSSDLTEKQASETDFLAYDKEKFNFKFSPNRVDEEDDGDTETESESESEREVGDGSVTCGDYKVIEDLPKPDPEWDVDSFDGLEYESDPELRARFANDNAYMEYREVRIQALENRGFLPDPFNFIDAIQNLDGPAYDNMTNREYLAGRASSCVKKLNDLKAKTVEFVSIVRATTTGGGASWKVYITFMAREYPNGPLMEYQAKAMDFVGDRSPVPILCRPAPKPLTLP